MADMFETPQKWGDGTDSTIGVQMNDFYWRRKSLVDLKKEQYFGQLSDTINMPKHFGKEIRVYHYIPMLDDRNINDQGIDATGKSTANEVTITITDAHGMTRYAVGEGVDAAAALVDARAKAVDTFKNIKVFNSSYNTTVTNLTAAGWEIIEGDAVNGAGNLWGSSKDVGTIVGKLPGIGEHGGRFNRVGFTRVTIEGRIEHFGYFQEYTKDSINFDSDSELRQHINREALRGANEITETAIQIDLLNGANVVFYGGDAISTDQLTGNDGEEPSELTYDTIARLEVILNDNRCPKDTTIITGSRMVDTKTIGAARYAYVGSELRGTLLRMKDYHDAPAFIPVHQYGEAGKLASGEIGAINSVRFIEVPDMLHWDGAGKAVNTNGGFLESNGRYNVYPLLIVGSGSFTTIGFQQDTEKGKFEIIHNKPGSSAADRFDPYGQTGFWSINWWYGTLILHPEWIALAKVVARQ